MGSSFPVRRGHTGGRRAMGEQEGVTYDRFEARSGMEGGGEVAGDRVGLGGSGELGSGEVGVRGGELKAREGGVKGGEHAQGAG